MTEDEIRGCLGMLRAYYPGEWPVERQAVWLDAFGGRPHPDVTDAIKLMAHTAEYPSVAAFTKALDPPRDAGVLTEGNRRFLPGTGWITEQKALG